MSVYFSAWCDAEHTDVLLGDGNIRRVVNGPGGPELHYRCHCGEEGVYSPRRETASAARN